MRGRRIFNKVIAGSVLYTSDFSAGDDGFGAFGGLRAGNIDSIGGENDTLRFTVDANDSQHYTVKAGLLTVNDYYRVQFRYYLPSANSDLDGIYLHFNQVTHSVTDTWTAVDYYVAARSTNLIFWAKQLTAWQDAGGDDVFYLKDVVVTRAYRHLHRHKRRWKC